jgi:putative transcriptional regulator
MLREWEAVRAALPRVDARFIRDTREKLRCSRALFARRLCMNPQTLEKWEQGVAKPNSQAERSAVTRSALSGHAGTAAENRTA